MSTSDSKDGSLDMLKKLVSKQTAVANIVEERAAINAYIGPTEKIIEKTVS